MVRGSLLIAVLLALGGLGTQQRVHNGGIVYSHLGADGNRSQIYTTTATGIRRRRLIGGRTFSNLEPSYSPNGKRIVFVRASKQSDLRTMNADGSDARRLTSTKGIGEIDPTWSPDGISDLQPAWSHDGSRILFSSGANDGYQLDLWTMIPDGGDRRQVTSTPGLDEHDPA